MKNSSEVRVVSRGPVCQTPERVRINLKREDEVEGYDAMSSVIQRSVNAISPPDTQIRLPLEIIDRIRELLLDESEGTEDFRTDALALIEPVAFIGKNIENQVDSTILTEAFGHTNQESLEEDKDINIVKFFEKYSLLLGYKSVERETVDYSEILTNETKVSLEVLRQLEDPSGAEKRREVLNKNINNTFKNLIDKLNQVKYLKERINLLPEEKKIEILSEIDKTKEDLKNRLEAFQDFDQYPLSIEDRKKTNGITEEIESSLKQLQVFKDDINIPTEEQEREISGIVKIMKQKLKQLKLYTKNISLHEDAAKRISSSPEERFPKIQDLLDGTSAEEWDSAFFLAIRTLKAGKEMITREKIQELLDEGHDYALSGVISNTKIGEEFAKEKGTLQTLLDKRMDHSLAASIYPMYQTEEGKALLDDETFFQSLLEKGMKWSFDSIICFSPNGQSFVDKNPKWEEECKKNVKNKLVTFQKREEKK